MTPARLQTMSLVCTAVIGLIVFAAAIEPPDLLVWINLFAFGGLEAVFLWPIILGLYWKEANASGAVASIVAGVACFFALSILNPWHGRHPRHRAHVHRRLRGVRHRREVRPPGFEEVIRLFWGEGNGQAELMKLLGEENASEGRGESPMRSPPFPLPSPPSLLPQKTFHISNPRSEFFPSVTPLTGSEI